MAEPFDPIAVADKIANGTVTSFDLRPQIRNLREALEAATAPEERVELQRQLDVALPYFRRVVDQEIGVRR